VFWLRRNPWAATGGEDGEAEKDYVYNILTGMIVRFAGLRDLDRRYRVGMLIEAQDTMKNDPEAMARWRERGRQHFKEHPEEVAALDQVERSLNEFFASRRGRPRGRSHSERRRLYRKIRDDQAAWEEESDAVMVEIMPRNALVECRIEQ
jgi:hypothetical protein